VAQSVADAGGSLVRAVEGLRREQGRSLVLLDPPDLGPVDGTLAETELLDPERTPDRWHHVRRVFAVRRRPARAGSSAGR
jgi:phospholipase D1/2